jgi:hypothetical protein
MGFAMSDEYITIIPEQPIFVPDPARQSQVVSYFSSIVPDSTEVKGSTNDHIQFVDCGENFESIKCPSCNKPIDMETWQEWMGMDYAEKGFNLNLHDMACCGARHTLHELKYLFPQGFAKYQLSAINANIGQLSESQVEKFEKILDCPVRVLYRRY